MAGQRSILSAEALSRCADLGRRISQQHRKRQYPWQPGLEFDWLPSVLEEKLKDGSSFMGSHQSLAFEHSKEQDSSKKAALQTSQNSKDKTPREVELDKLSQEADNEVPNFRIDDKVFDGNGEKIIEPDIQKGDNFDGKTTEGESTSPNSAAVLPPPDIQVQDDVELVGESSSKELLTCNKELLSKEISDVLTELHQRWTQGEQVEFGPEYQFFTSCSPQQMESACCELLKLGLSEVAMCGACHFMAQVTPPPSHTNCCVFIRQCLLPQLPDTENESASRMLSAAMVEFARKYPRPFVETAVMPLLTRMGEGSWLWDVLNKLVTEPDTQQQDLVSILQVLYGAETWSESTVALLQTVVNQKPPLDTTSLSDLTTATQGQAEKLNSNLKFTKLVLAIIKTYGKDMSQDDVKRLTMVLDCNQTFLKRAASAALKRLTIK
ncbi:Fanconi anemia group E protein-like isoform X1 [Branchiostoma floridae x Branchiostoma japonicum]